MLGPDGQTLQQVKFEYTGPRPCEPPEHQSPSAGAPWVRAMQAPQTHDSSNAREAAPCDITKLLKFGASLCYFSLCIFYCSLLPPTPSCLSVPPCFAFSIPSSWTGCQSGRYPSCSSWLMPLPLHGTVTLRNAFRNRRTKLKALVAQCFVVPVRFRRGVHHVQVTVAFQFVLADHHQLWWQLGGRTCVVCP